MNRELAALKRAGSLAARATPSKLHVRPFIIPMLAEDNTREGFFEREQFEAVRRHLPEALRPFVTVAYITGWRVPSELLPLMWSRVDFKAGTLRLDAGTTQNKDGRMFVITPELHRPPRVPPERPAGPVVLRGMARRLPDGGVSRAAPA